MPRTALEARHLRNFSQPRTRRAALQLCIMDFPTAAELGLPAAAGVLAYLFRHWWWPPGPEAGPPLLAT